MTQSQTLLNIFFSLLQAFFLNPERTLPCRQPFSQTRCTGGAVRGLSAAFPRRSRGAFPFSRSRPPPSAPLPAAEPPGPRPLPQPAELRPPAPLCLPGATSMVRGGAGRRGRCGGTGARAGGCSDSPLCLEPPVLLGRAGERGRGRRSSGPRSAPARSRRRAGEGGGAAPRRRARRGGRKELAARRG